MPKQDIARSHALHTLPKPTGIMKPFLKGWRGENVEGMILGDPLAVALAVAGAGGDNALVSSASKQRAACSIVLDGGIG